MKILSKLNESLKSNIWLFKGFLFSIIYYVVAVMLYHVVAEIHIQEPKTLFSPIDYLIPFIPFFVIFYVFIFYPFVIFTLGYFLFYRTGRTNQFFTALMIVYAISYITYIIFPVMMIRPSPEELPNDFLSKVMAKYYELDPPLNCFPSLHAANSTLAAYFLSKEKKDYSILWWFIAFMVILSTLFVRQHVIADEIAGFLVAYFAGYLAERKIPTSKDVGNKKIRMIIFVVLATLISLFEVLSYIP